MQKQDKLMEQCLYCGSEYPPGVVCSSAADAGQCDNYKTMTKSAPGTSAEDFPEVVGTESAPVVNRENISHPTHYTTGKIEVKDFYRDQLLPPHLCNAIKYICRAGKKNPETWKEDLEKAVQYIEFLIEEVNETGEFPSISYTKVPITED
jgi:hypothetical protein